MIRTATLLLLYAAAGWGSLPTDTALTHLLVRTGATATLPCDFKIYEETMWFVQREQTLTLAVLATRNPAELNMGPFELLVLSDRRLSLALNSSSDTSSLSITSVTEVDLALYYCAVRDRGRIEIGAGIRLVYEGSDGPTVSCPEAGEGGWLSRSWLPATCALISALLSSACVYGLCHRIGVTTEPQSPQHSVEQSRHGDPAQEENGGVNYARVGILTVQPLGREREAAGATCMYSEVNKRSST